jgi:hypothetical protein
LYFIHFLKCSESSFDINVSCTIMKSFFLTIQVLIFGYSIIYLFQQPIISQVRIIENNRLDHKSQSNVPSIAILETDYEFRDKIKDETAFPFIETNISVNLGSYFFKSFLQDGSVLSYSPQGEKELFHNCRGILCLVVTNKNILGVSNNSSVWSKGNFYGDINFKFKLGNQAGFVVTDRNIYLYNGILNEWERISLKGESVLAVSNKNDLAAIVTSRRIIAFSLTNKNSTETSLKNRNISHYGIKEDTIHFYSFDKVFKYEKDSNEITEEFLDKN